MPSSFLLFIWFLSLAALVVILFFFREHLRRSGLISRSLSLVLLLVRFSPVEKKEDLSVEQIRQKISLMEQFYANLHMVRDIWWKAVLYGKPSFAMELTIPSVGEEISFYVAVPRRFARSVEKIIQGIFPEANIEESRDYNIFNPEGETAASRAVLKKNNFYPIKTYQKLEGDP